MEATYPPGPPPSRQDKGLVRLLPTCFYYSVGVKRLTTYFHFPNIHLPIITTSYWSALGVVEENPRAHAKRWVYATPRRTLVADT
jgi:hypothetical protein